MDNEELLGKLRELIEREQHLYKEYTKLANQAEDEEIKELLGHMAYEEFSHLTALLENYKSLIDRKKGT